MAPPTASKLSTSADKEWQHWGQCTWNCITGKRSSGHHDDDESKFAKYVIGTYLPPFYKSPIKWPTESTISNDDYAWSAVAISYFMMQAGFKRKPLLPSGHTDSQYAAWVAASQPDEYPISQSHSDYIRWAIRARNDGIETAAYWGYRIDEDQAIPEVGDLIGYPRTDNLTKDKALKFFDRKSGYNSHTDLVVAKRSNEIDVIGGNVRDSVTKKTLPINAKGQVVEVDGHPFFWFAVMKRR